MLINGQKNLKWILICGLIFMTACQNSNLQDPVDENGIVDEEKLAEKVIYGDDDRKDVYQVTDPRLLRLADSTVALVQKRDVRDLGNGQSSVTGEVYGRSMGLCLTEPFYDQEAAGFCSGALVAPDIIITAGHCIKTQTDCNNTQFVFGYAVKTAGVLPKNVPTSEIYSCSRIIKQVLTAGGADFAVIQLDRRVPNHSPLPVRRSQSGSSAVIAGDNVTVIGHPSGLPTKIASGGKVRSVASAHFVTNLDTYGGNSGSAVFNSATGEIEGILVRGEQDFKSSGSCMVSNRCAEGACRGEDVTRIDQVIPHLPVVDVTPEPTPQPTPAPTPVPTPTPPPVVQPIEVSVNANLLIPDANSTGVQSSLSISEAPRGRKVLVSVDVSHSYIGDLTLTLVDPSGKSYVLQAKKGGRTRDIRGTYGAGLVSQTDLKVLSQVTSVGTWKLKLVDSVRVDTGSLKSWKLRFE